jgi:hypothetical protein
MVNVVLLDPPALTVNARYVYLPSVICDYVSVLTTQSVPTARSRLSDLETTKNATTAVHPDVDSKTQSAVPTTRSSFTENVNVTTLPKRSAPTVYDVNPSAPNPVKSTRTVSAVNHTLPTRMGNANAPLPVRSITDHHVQLAPTVKTTTGFNTLAIHLVLPVHHTR